MGERESFLRAVIAKPDDDLPRLIFADWLQDHGEPERAEFIRVQVELASLSPNDSAGQAGCLCTNCTLARPLRRRERELLEGRGMGWLDGLLGHGWKLCHLGRDSGRDYVEFTASDGRRTGRITPAFRRGFVSEITCSWPDWLAHHAAIREATPLRRVRLTTRPEIETQYHPGERRTYYRVPGWAVAHFIDDVWVSRIRHGSMGDEADQLVIKLLAAEFQGIQFELPPVRPIDSWEAWTRHRDAIGMDY